MVGEKTFREAAEQFLREYEIITEGRRNAQYVEGHGRRLKLHLLPFFGRMGLSEISAGKLQEYRIHRRENTIAERGKAPSRSTLHQEIVVPSPSAENRHPARVAQASAGFVRTFPLVGENIAPRVVLSGGIPNSVRSDARAGEEPKAQAIPMGI